MTLVSLEQIEAPPGDLAGNTAQILRRAKAALSDGVDIAVFPELANSGYTTDPELVAKASQPLDGPFISELTALASRFGGLVATGYCEMDGGAFYNSVALVGAEGPILNYRKIHLFDAEHDMFSAGDSLPVVETEFGILGVCVCYDLRFVEVLRILSLKGADIVLAPAAWVGGFDRHVPSRGLIPQAEAAIVQANLDQVAVVAVSQVSAVKRNGLRTLGGSVAVDAFGKIVAGPLSRRHPDVARATIDIDAGRAARERSLRIRPRADRRLDVYGLRYGKEIW